MYVPNWHKQRRLRQLGDIVFYIMRLLQNVDHFPHLAIGLYFFSTQYWVYGQRQDIISTYLIYFGLFVFIVTLMPI